MNQIEKEMYNEPICEMCVFDKLSFDEIYKINEKYYLKYCCGDCLIKLILDMEQKKDHNYIPFVENIFFITNLSQIH